MYLFFGCIVDECSHYIHVRIIQGHAQMLCINFHLLSKDQINILIGQIASILAEIKRMLSIQGVAGLLMKLYSKDGSMVYQGGFIPFRT